MHIKTPRRHGGKLRVDCTGETVGHPALCATELRKGVRYGLRGTNPANGPIGKGSRSTPFRPENVPRRLPKKRAKPPSRSRSVLRIIPGVEAPLPSTGQHFANRGFQIRMLVLLVFPLRGDVSFDAPLRHGKVR